jgi:predicted nucleotidyltransferase
MKRLNNDLHPQGSDLSVGEIKYFFRKHFHIVNKQYLTRTKIKDIEIIGSRLWGQPRSTSDLDILVYYEGEINPQEMKGLFAMSNNRLLLGDLETDMTFIKRPIEECLDSSHNFKQGHSVLAQ